MADQSTVDKLLGMPEGDREAALRAMDNAELEELARRAAEAEAELYKLRVGLGKAEGGPEGFQAKCLSAKEFRDEGYLQEANRYFFHPFGLALGLVVDPEKGADTGDFILAVVYDHRDDPEGVYFSDGTLDKDKAALVRQQGKERYHARVRALGHWIQPTGVRSVDED